MFRTTLILQVLLLSTALADVPVQIIFSPPDTAEVLEGSSLRLRCRAESAMPILYRWLRDGIEVESGSILSISRLRAVHEGSYICIAETDSGSDTSEICRVTLKRKNAEQTISLPVQKFSQQLDSAIRVDTLKDSAAAEKVKFILPGLFFGEHLGGDSSRLVFQIQPQRADSLYLWFGVSSNPEFRDSLHTKKLDPGFFYSESDSDTISLTIRDSIFLISDKISAALTLSFGSIYSDTIFTSFSCRNSGSKVNLNYPCSQPEVNNVFILKNSGEICIVINSCSSGASNLFAAFEPVGGSQISSIYTIVPGQDSIRLKLSRFIPGAIYNVSIIREGSAGFPAQRADYGQITLKIPGNPDPVPCPEKPPEILRVDFRQDSVIFVNSIGCDNPEQVLYSIVNTQGNTIWSRTVIYDRAFSDTLIWDGFSDKYTPVPAGFYIFRIVVIESGNSKKKVGFRQFLYNPIRGNIKS